MGYQIISITVLLNNHAFVGLPQALAQDQNLTHKYNAYNTV